VAGGLGAEEKQNGDAGQNECEIDRGRRKGSDDRQIAVRRNGILHSLLRTEEDGDAFSPSPGKWLRIVDTKSHENRPGRVRQGDCRTDCGAGSEDGVEAETRNLLSVYVGFDSAGVLRSEEQRERRMGGGKVDAKAVPLPFIFLDAALLVENDGLPAVVKGISVGPGEVVAGAIEPSSIEGSEGRGHAVELEGDGGGSGHRDSPRIGERSN